MDKSEALETVEALAHGIDPVTGEILPEDSPFNHPRIIRALFLSINALERLKEGKSRASDSPRNAGKPWTKEDDQTLLEGYDRGNGAKVIAQQCFRTQGAISARLVRLGRISERSDVLDH